VRLYDLLHSIATGMLVFPGDPAVQLEPAAAVPPWRASLLKAPNVHP